MFRTLCLLSFILVFSTSIVAQDLSSLEQVAALNRMSEALRIVNFESKQEGSDLELVEEQKQKLKLLRSEYVDAVSAYSDILSKAPGSGAAVVSISERVAKLEKKLNDEILVPHQVEFLKTMVFAKSVEKQGGNFVKATIATQIDILNLNEAQARKLFALEKSVAEKIAEAEKEFKKELDEIAKDARSSTKKILSPKQQEALDGMRVR